MPLLKPAVTPVAATTPPRRETRALWVVCYSLATPEEVKEVVRRARDNGFTDLVVQVRGRGDAWYKSSLEPRADALSKQPVEFDPLAMTIDEAHRVGIKVHAWLNVYIVSNLMSLPKSQDHLIYKHPDWMMVPRGIASELYNVDPKSPQFLQKITDYARANRNELEGLFTSPANPEVKENLTKIWVEVAQKYDVDGLHFDYVRYPNPQFDYSRASIDLFRAEVDKDLPAPNKKLLSTQFAADPMIYATTYPARYAQFQRNQVTDQVARIYKAVKAIKPNVVISGAVFANDEDALKARFQDWKLWLKRGWLDVLCPMAYTPNTALFRKQMVSVMSNSGGKPVWGGIGAYRQLPESALEKIRVTREVGAQGFILFSYGSSIQVSELNPQGDYLERMRDGMQVNSNAGPK
ncbi:MAG TPA: family 10 glycosylhydrolase [Blastocatellia bacterium]|nr:family 10 glycosylhydrolase [Blastocatellia bacterium]